MSGRFVMRGLIGLIAAAVPLLLWASPTLLWDPSAGAEGYYVYLEPTPIAGNPAQYGTVGEGSTSFDAGPYITAGVQYEAWVTAYLTQPETYESAESNHIRFTPALPVEVITIPAQPSSLTIQFGSP